MAPPDGVRAVTVHKYACGDTARFESTSSEQDVVFKSWVPSSPSTAAALQQLSRPPSWLWSPSLLPVPREKTSSNTGVTAQDFDVCSGLAARFYQQKLTEQQICPQTPKVSTVRH